MPITPLHFGPGVLIKSVSPKKVSMAMFVFVNIAIDLEPVTWYLLTGDPAHAYLHTYLGATLLALLCAVLGRKPCEKAIAFWNSRLSTMQSRWLGASPEITVSVALFSAIVGTWSHIFLDSIMHADIRPFWPLSEENDLRGMLPVEYLHLLCIVWGVWGLLRLLTARWDVLRKNVLDAPWRPLNFKIIAEKIGRDTTGVIRTVIGVIGFAWAFMLPFQVATQNEMNSAAFDKEVWDTSKDIQWRPNNPRVKMVGDLQRRLERDRPTKNEVLQLLGPLVGGRTENQEWHYDVGNPSVGIGWAFLVLEFDSEGRVRSTTIYRD